MQLLKKPNILIVGAGPVGLTCALLCQKLKLPFKVIEQKQDLAQHPAAHYINMRSMEIFSEISGLDQEIYARSEPLENFRYYRYCRDLFAPERDKVRTTYMVTDQFAPSIEAKLKEIAAISARPPCHLPQHKLARILYDHLIKKSENTEGVQFGVQAKQYRSNGPNTPATLTVLENGKERNLEADFILACDGFHSTIRQQSGIQLLGKGKILNFLNLFFTSHQLAELMDKHKEHAMLHFIYNPEIVGVLVNHSMKDGEFVLQVPMSPPFMEVSQYNEKLSKKLVNQLIHPSNRIRDNEIKINHIGSWNLSAMHADKYFHDRMVLVGDSAHSMPPAGGFGMNTGIHEAHNLIFKLADIANHPTKASFLLDQYSKERKQIVEETINVAEKYYNVSVQIADKLGRSMENLNTLKTAVHLIPAMDQTTKSSIFKNLVQMGSSIVDMIGMDSYRPRLRSARLEIPLIIPEQDILYQYHKLIIQPGERIGVLEAKRGKEIGRLIPLTTIKLLPGEKEISSRHLASTILQTLVDKEQKSLPNHFLLVSDQMFKSEKTRVTDEFLKEIEKKFGISCSLVVILGKGHMEVNQIASGQLGVYFVHESKGNAGTLEEFVKPNELVLLRSDSFVIAKLEVVAHP